MNRLGSLPSYSDLIALRIVSWLRYAKTADVGDLPATSQTVAALAERGYDPAQIASRYDEPEQAIREAMDLERQLAGSVVAA